MTSTETTKLEHVKRRDC